jgi:hypothetical protein
MVLGEFVLEEGRFTESDRFGIEVIKIGPMVTCLRPLEEPSRKNVTLKIYRPSDKEVLCEATAEEGSGDLQCANGHQLPSFSINSINTKERWVFLSLGETVSDQ